jgi:hypothetical protein
MRWSGFAVLAGLATLYFLLAGEAEGLLAGFGYVASALLYVLSFLNLVKPKNSSKKFVFGLALCV